MSAGEVIPLKMAERIKMAFDCCTGLPPNEADFGFD
jgi:hypothetical protein